MNNIFKENKGIAIAVIASLLVLVSAAFIWRWYASATHRGHSTDIPALPDLTGQPKVLVDYLQRVNEEAMKFPSSDHAVGDLAMAYQSNFFYDEAKACYERAFELNPHDWRWVYYSALIDEELGDTKATIEKLNRVLELNPEVSQAWFRLGNSYLKTNSYTDAEKAFHQVLALRDFFPETEPGIEHTNSGAFPLKAYASFNLARAEFQQNKLEDAKKTLEGIVEHHPKFGPAYRLLATVFQKSGDEQRSASLETRAGDFESYLPPSDPMYDSIILSSRNTALVLKQFDIAAKSENYEWTLSLMNHLIEISPGDGEVLSKRIKLALDMQKLSTVDSLLPSFFKICGSDEKKLIDMAKYLSYRGQYEPAVIVLQRAITINPKTIDAHIAFIDILMEFKQYEMGINYCQEMISTEPRNAEIRNKLARIYIDQGNLEEARRQMKIAQQLSPNAETSFLMLGRISKKEGAVKSALAYYQKALMASPRNVNTQLEVGNFLVDLGRWADAFLHYQNSLKSSPNDIDLIERYAWALAVCPFEDSANGRKAFELADRLTLRRRYTKDQEMRCGMTLAAAYARTGHFDQALEVANKFVGWAKTMRDSSYLRRLQSMIRCFQDKKPYAL